LSRKSDQEPSGFRAAIEGPLDLAGTDPFLAAADQLDCLEPQMRREMAILENRAYPHGESLAVGIALTKAGAAALAGQASDALVIAVSTVRECRPLGHRCASTHFRNEEAALEYEIPSYWDRQV
jgi:hypothetical protein